MKIHSLIKFITLIIAVMASVALHAEQNADSITEFLNNLSTCSALTDTLVYSTHGARITLASDPKGYCIFTTPDYTCKLSQDDVNQLVKTLDVEKIASTTPDSDVTKTMTAISKFHGCVSNPVPQAPVVLPPAGAVPIGTPLSVPYGMQAAPGTPTTVPAPAPK